MTFNRSMNSQSTHGNQQYLWLKQSNIKLNKFKLAFMIKIIGFRYSVNFKKMYIEHDNILYNLSS
jgi:hypothetical protein